MTAYRDFEEERCGLRQFSREIGKFHEFASIHRHLDRFDLYQKINNVIIYNQKCNRTPKSMKNEGAHHG